MRAHHARREILGWIGMGLLAGAISAQAAIQEKLIDTLNTLIQHVEDARQGYQTAADRVKPDELKQLFQDSARQHAKLEEELQRQVRELGGEPTARGSALGAAHQGWSTVKNAATGSDKALLTEVIRGEEMVLESYDKALEATLPTDLETTLKRQKSQVQKSLSAVRTRQKALVD